MVHHTVKMRQDNIREVREWVGERKAKDFNAAGWKALTRKVMINLGVQRSKAREYISLVLGDEE